MRRPSLSLFVAFLTFAFGCAAFSIFRTGTGVKVARQSLTSVTEREQGNGRLFPVFQDRKVGYMNQTGKLIIAPQFDLPGNIEPDARRDAK